VADHGLALSRIRPGTTFGRPGLSGERIGAEYQISSVTPGLSVFADFPDEVENGWIAAAFRRERPDAACSQHHRYVQEMCDEPVGGLLKGCAFDVPKPLKA
jgi:hypothetical protein